MKKIMVEKNGRGNDHERHTKLKSTKWRGKKEEVRKREGRKMMKGRR